MDQVLFNIHARNRMWLYNFPVRAVDASQSTGLVLSSAIAFPLS